MKRRKAYTASAAAATCLLLFFTVTGLQGRYKGHPGDVILPGLEPPQKYYTIPGGSCGEACLWSIARSRGLSVSQEQINVIGGRPGRGLYAYELFYAVRGLHISYKNLSGMAGNYRNYLNSVVYRSLQQGRPVLLGVKIYPDRHPLWSCDHFILLTGYNPKNREVIYNSNNRRDRVTLEKLLNKKKGYSIISRTGYVFALEF